MPFCTHCFGEGCVYCLTPDQVQALRAGTILHEEHNLHRAQQHFDRMVETYSVCCTGCGGSGCCDCDGNGYILENGAGKRVNF